jgi:hypothetical protein
MKRTVCSKCGRPLKDPFSIAIGMGPECRGGLIKAGWRFPKPQFAVRDGHVTFIGVSGKIEPPVGDLTKDKKKKANNVEKPEDKSN